MFRKVDESITTHDLTLIRSKRNVLLHLTHVSEEKSLYKALADLHLKHKVLDPRIDYWTLRFELRGQWIYDIIITKQYRDNNEETKN